MRCLHQAPLRLGNAQQRAEEIAPARAPHEPRPEPLLDRKIDALLLGQRRCLQQRIERGTNTRKTPEMAHYRPGQRPAGAAIVEGLPRSTALEHVDVIVPEPLLGLRQFGAQRRPVDPLRLRVPAVTEEAKEILEGQRPQRAYLQREQRVLTRIHVDREHLCRCIQQVVERVAACRGDDHHPRRGIQRHRLAVRARILPAHVVDQIVAVNAREERIRQPALHRAGQTADPIRSANTQRFQHLQTPQWKRPPQPNGSRPVEVTLSWSLRLTAARPWRGGSTATA